MAFDLTELPRGLTAALGVRDMGRLPQQLDERVQLVVDGLDPYLFNRRETVTQSGLAPSGAGTFDLFTSLTVPAGEAWYVWAYQVAVTLDPTERALWLPAQRVGGGVVVCGPQNDQTAPAGVAQAYFTPAEPVRWLAPGDGFGFVASNTSGAPSFSATVVLTRLRI